MSLDAEVGGITANSYVTEDEAEEYFENRGLLSDWTALSSTEGQLISATLFLDWYVRFGGTKATAEQAREWPRTGATDRDGQAIPEDVIPTAVKQATMECAFYFGKSGDPLAPSELAGLKEVKAGSLTLKVDPSYGSGSAPKTPVPSFVYRILAGLYSGYGAPNKSLIVVSD